ncbi:oxidation resistance protein 1-like isoform X2 [Stegodyphus dumicola]|uniref:oxidation resistance protein 1-like isoform X2 n=1 Tax=Stegodyphus dumicola TaxID=202533 RepID=UPI0015B1ABB1|nr:oxidation resistance protein 1-like isoform X2 [Stegodyphus dumicola]
MDNHQEIEDDGKGVKPWNVDLLLEKAARRSSIDKASSRSSIDKGSSRSSIDEGYSRKSSLTEISDGRRPSFTDKESDIISEAEEEYIRKMHSDRRASFRPQPRETVPYEVQSSDTLEGIAARYNITPSELAVLNKLSYRTVFPGQIIYIPEKNSLQVLEQILKQSAAAINASSEQSSPKPGHVERVPDASSSSKEEKGLQADVQTKTESEVKPVEESSKESLRINSKYVTDGEGVVNGVLIVTTNHIIFDPNVSDPLVIEYGLEKYGVDAPMNCIVRAALYTDIFRMRTKDTSTGESKVDVYHSTKVLMRKSKSHNEKLAKNEKSKPPRRYSSAEVGVRHGDLGMKISNSFQDSLSKICENADFEEEDETESPALVVEDIDISVSTEPEAAETKDSKRTTKPPLSASSSLESDDAPGSRKASISDDDNLTLTVDAISPKKKSNFEKTKHKLHKGLKRLSITDGLFSNPHGGRRMSLPAFTSLPDFKLKSPTVKSPNAEKTVKSISEMEKPKQSGPTYVNMVDEKPELFAPVDKLIPRPAKSFCDTPLYLCLRMGEPIDKTLQRTSPVVHFGQQMKPEYWFSIPKDSVDSLYCFFLRWCPEKYGDIDNLDLEKMGFTPIEYESKEECEEKAPRDHRRASWAFPWRRKSKDVTEMSATSSPEDWEFLDCVTSKSDVIHPPELLTPSNILSDEQILELNKHMPARAMNPWDLIYGTAVHGFSLKTMYRNMTKFDSPVLLVIANRSNIIFGALLSSPLRMSDHFYGTGESFLFTFFPEFKIYHWSGENNYIMKGNTNSFVIGSSEGHFALWLDDDLFRGRTNSCQTFANDPLCPEEDFEIKGLEAWGFV